MGPLGRLAAGGLFAALGAAAAEVEEGIPWAGIDALSDQSLIDSSSQPGQGCLLALIGNGRYEPGSVVEGNCGFDFGLGIPADAPHCPRHLPIALMLVPKAASVSLLNWLVELDGSTQRLADVVRRFERSALDLCAFMQPSSCPRAVSQLEQFRNSMQLISLLTGGEPPRGTTADIGTMEGMEEAYMRFSAWVMDGLLPYPRPCLRCCTGDGRLPAVVLRHPVARVMAYFQRAWMDKASKAHQTLATFTSFAQVLAVAAASNAFAQQLQRGEGFDGIAADGSALKLDVQDLYHTQPLAELLAEHFTEEVQEDLALLASCEPADCWYRRRLFVLRIEVIQEDLDMLRARLCLQRGLCQPFPEVKHLNFRSSHQKVEAEAYWSSGEGQGAAALLESLYAYDVRLGGYLGNVSEPLPMQPDRQRLQPPS